MGTLPEAPPATIAFRRADAETRHVLGEANRAWQRFSCQASGECCHFEVTGRQPWLWPSEWRTLLAALRRDGRALPPARADGACPFLDAANRCTVYEARPLGCRTFFCHRRVGPGREPAAATNALAERLAALNLATDPQATPRPMLDWWASEDAATPPAPAVR